MRQAAPIRRGLFSLVKGLNMANATQNPKSDNPEMAELLRKMDSLEKAMQEKDAEIQALKDQQLAGLKVLPGASRPYCGPDGGYKFRIEPKFPEKYPHLKPLTENACDESELIRYYCAVNEEVKGSNKRLDPVRCLLTVTCLDEGKRKNLTYHKQRLANIRMRLDQGHTVSAEDQAMIDSEYRILQGMDKN
jgi:hypothetical protein